MNVKDEKANPHGITGFAAVYGSPGARVRFIGFFSIFWPFLIVVFFAGWLIAYAFPIKNIGGGMAGVLLIALAVVAWLAFASAAKRFESYVKGARGEEAVARELAMLPAGWDVFHGVPRGRFDGVCGGGDFDHIVIGPDTLFVIETKNWDGPVTLERGVMRVRGRTPNRSPVAQVRNEANELTGILKDAIPEGVVVTPVICFANNSYAADEGMIDDVHVCNARMLRSIIMETSGGFIDEQKRRLILDSLAHRLGA
ncbi:MAG: nuclease-related domain-containing protein [Kiritimatiellia bacterium]